MRIGRQILLLSTLIFTLVSCNVDKKNEDKKVFVYNQAGVLGSLDPAFATDQAIGWATTQIFNGLVELNSDLEVGPSLAASWEVLDSGRTYVFHLREGVRFHDDPLFDGDRILKASDFAYSFKRVCDTTSVYNKGIWIFKDKVLKDAQGLISDTCFKAVDEYTFKIYLEDAYPYFLQVLTMPYAYVVPKEVCEEYGQDFRSHPIGTGPFKMHTWSEGNTLILHKNEDYWKRDKEGARLPYLDAVQVYFIPDKSQAFRAFQVGDLDFISGIDEGSIDDLLYSNGSFKETALAQMNVVKCPYMNTEYIGIQLDPEASVYKGKDHVLLNMEFRKALNYAVDRERLVRNLRNGLGIPGHHGIVPPAVPNYDLNQVGGYVFDKDKAKQSLKNSGIDPRTIPELELYVAKEHKRIGEYIVKSWEEVLGIKAKILINEPKVIRGMANRGEVALFTASWLGDYADAENYLALFYGDNWTPHGPNKVHFKNAISDSLYEHSKYLTGIDRQLDNQRMDSVSMQYAPIIPLYYDEIVRLSSKRVLNFEPNAMNLLKLESVDLR